MLVGADKGIRSSLLKGHLPFLDVKQGLGEFKILRRYFFVNISLPGGLIIAKCVFP